MAAAPVNGSTGALVPPGTAPSCEDINAFIFDLGSLYVRVGLAGEDCPKHYAYSVVGYPTASAVGAAPDVEGCLDDADDAMLTRSSENETMAASTDPLVTVNEKNDSSTTSAMADSMDRVSCPGSPKLRHTPWFAHPVLFSALQRNLEIKPCLFQPSKQQALSQIPEDLDSLLAPVEPLELDTDHFVDLTDRIFGYDPRTCLSEQLRGRPVMFTEPNKHNKSIRAKMAELFFELFEAEAVYAAKRAVLSAFSVGRSDGLVIDIGTASTTITPVLEGFTLQRPAVELPVGGDLLDYQLWQYLRRANLQDHVVPVCSVAKTVKLSSSVPIGVAKVTPVDTSLCRPSFLGFGKRETLRQLKEHIARTANDSLPDSLMKKEVTFGAHSIIGKHFHVGEGRYELPDGTSLLIDDVAPRLTECLFNINWVVPPLGKEIFEPTDYPGLQGCTGLVQAIGSAILNCDADCRRDLSGSIILVGGGSLVAGLGERLTWELQYSPKSILGTTAKYKVIFPTAASGRRFSSWIGGSILASLGSFQQMWLGRLEYEECGSSLIERRCIQ